MVKIENISKSFKDNAALQGINLTIESGEIFGLVGPDGAGKSTLLRLLAGILDPDSGKITVQGMNVADDPFAVKEIIAYMPQRFGLYEDLTVEENIFFFGKLFGLSISQISTKLDRLYHFSNLGPFKDRLSGKLSGGMKQKLGLACCLVHDPNLILLDEPTNGVDPISRRELWQIIYDLVQDGISVIVATAYLDEAERCGRVALMHEGKILAMDEPRRIKESIREQLVLFESQQAGKAETILLSEFSSYVARSGRKIRFFYNPDRQNLDDIFDRLGDFNIDIQKKQSIAPSLEDSFVYIITQRQAS